MLEKVWVHHFRNLNDVKVDFESYRHMYIYGNNNQGKTNFLEALYYVGHGKGPSTNTMESLIQFEKDACYMGVDVSSSEDVSRIYMKMDYQNGRQIQLNDKFVYKMGPVQKVCPVDYLSSDISREFTSSPDERRRSIDKLLGSYFPEYSSILKQYRAILKQKVAVLKDSGDPQLVRMYNKTLVELSEQLVSARLNIVSSLQSELNLLLRKLNVFEFKSVGIDYMSKLSDSAIETAGRYCELLSDKLDMNFDKERYAKAALYGPHRDDISILLDQRNIMIYASKGIRRLMSILLKVAGLNLLRGLTNRYPILLLDDVFSEMDSNLKSVLVPLIMAHTQVVYCTTQKDDASFFKDVGIFTVANGTFSYEETL